MHEKLRFPIVKYLSYLLIVSILFTGVTFSRYGMKMSGEPTIPLSRYHCYYEVEDIASTSIPNVNYWLSNGSAASTARTLRYTIRNHRDGVISEVDVLGNLRIKLPSEMASHLAFQLVNIDPVSGAVSSGTPEIVLEELIFGKQKDENGDALTDENGFALIDRNTYLTHSGETVNTADFRNYYDNGIQNMQDETLYVHGTLSPAAAVRTITASNMNGSGITMTVSASFKEAEYSVGFQRGKTENDFAPPLFLDMKKETEFYTLDISLPSMRMKGGSECSETYILYLCLTERVDGNDFKGSWITDNSAESVVTQSDGGIVTAIGDYNAIISEPPDGNKKYYYNGAEVTGYHFDQPSYYVGSDRETTVRVRCDYDYNGGYNVSLYHVAPVSEDSTASYVHSITSEQGEFVFDSQTGEFVNTLTEGTCSNNGDPIDISALYGDPFSGGEMSAFQVLSKSYEVNFTALFVQASET